MTQRVAVVAHTHWDREWYEPFPEFRRRLVTLLDGFLEHLERDPTFSHFLLDGQLAVVDDYLSIRPDAADAVARLVAAGRLAIGPWYILMDEFLVSGETIIRNLQLGLARAASFGGAMAVGYLPDMFGHIAQMPQVLRAAGLEHSVVWRGVPAAIDRNAFWWRAPDGSTVRAEYLPIGYSNGAHLPEDGPGLLHRLRAELSAQASFLDGSTLLVMAGTDHQVPQTGLPAALDAVNDLEAATSPTGGPSPTATAGVEPATHRPETGSADRLDVALTSLSEYLEGASRDGLLSWTGELRSSARSNLLMGVVSNRSDVRRAVARAERDLERMAEPLATLWTAPTSWPARELAEAWLAMIRNSAHDSICACSHDDVTTTVLQRYGEVTAVADGIVRSALADAAGASAGAGVMVLNPAANTRSGIVEVVCLGSEVAPGTQVVAAIPAGTTEARGVGSDFERLRGELMAAGWPVDDPGNRATFEHGPAGMQLRIDLDPTRSPDHRYLAAVSEAAAIAAANPTEALVIWCTRPAWQRILARASDVPGFGWSLLASAASVPPPASDQVAPVDGGATWLSNGLLHVAVNPADGTFSLNGLSGLDRLVDSGDEGDTYNYSPPADDVVVDRPASVTVTPLEVGPVRGRLRITRRFQWPDRLVDGHRAGASDTVVTTDVEIRAGESLVRVETAFDHHSRDHRLRAVFPLPVAAKVSRAECAFTVVERGLEAEGGPGERGLATYPSRRFVTAGGLTFTHEGVPEYELIDDGRALAVTLIRATGILSQPAPTYRPNSAGPQLPLAGPQMIGPVRFRYAVALGDHDPYRLADDAWLPLPVVRATGGGTLGDRGTRLDVSGAEVSCLRRVAGGVELRVFNPSASATYVQLRGRSGVLVDLTGTAQERFDGGFALRPHGIATALIDAPLIDV